MYPSDEYQKLQYQYEMLLAQLELKDVFHKTIVQEVYENITQVLSLVRVQLSQLQTELNYSPHDPESPGELIGRAIRDLRIMCRNFYPETELLQKQGLHSSISQEIHRIYKSGVNKIQVRGNCVDLDRGIELILFRILQELIGLIHLHDPECTLRVGFKYAEDCLMVAFVYHGDLINFNSSAVNGMNDQPRLKVPERIEIIKGKLRMHTGRDGVSKVYLKIPFSNL